MPIGVSIWGPIAASAVGGWLASRRKGQQTQTSTSTPTFDPAFTGLRDQLLKIIGARLQTPINLDPYQSQGIQDINRNFDLLRQSQSNDLTARGLGTSPVAAAVDAARGVARTGAISRFNNSLPLLQRQLENENFGLASGLLGLGIGRTATGTGFSEDESGGGAAGSAENLAAMLGYMSRNGMFRRGGSPTGGDGGYYPPSDTWGWG